MIEWALGGLQMYKNRQDLADLAKHGMTSWLGKKTSIAITGMAGVGKTVLRDHLTGKVFEKGYESPRQSQAMETGKVAAQKKRISLSVVPGQVSEPRNVALDELFNTATPVQGVIHVVGNGLATLRSADARDVLIESGVDTIAKLRDSQLADERADLEETCEEIVRAHIRNHEPKWMLVVVDKVDLFQSTIDSVRRYYSRSSDSPFVKILKELETRVGTEFFRWETVPVSATLERFEWNGDVLTPQIDDDYRKAYLTQLLSILKSYCA
jgi:nucleoside-triphosphatase THEP1